MRRRFFLTLWLIGCLSIPASALTLDQVSPFSVEDLWLLKQAKTIIETYQVNDKKIDDRAKIHGALRGLVQSFNDPYTRFVTPEELEEEERESRGIYGGIGLVVSEKDGAVVAVSPIDDTPAWRAGFRPKDQIVKIDDEVVVGKPLNDVVKKLRGKAGTKVTVWIRRDGEDELIEMPMVREDIKLESVKSTLLPQNKKVGYIRLSQFIATSADDVKKAIESLSKNGAKGLILDLRNNGGGLLDAATKISDFFLDDGPIVETRGSYAEKFSATKGTATNLPLVILVNEGSASASEIVSGALRDRNRAILVGEKTFGKGSVQTLFNLTDQSGIYVTVAKYYTPGGEVIDHVGLTPNVVAKAPELKPMTDAERAKRKKDAEAYEKMNNQQRKAENEKVWKESLQDDLQLNKAVEIVGRLMKGAPISKIAPYTPKPSPSPDVKKVNDTSARPPLDQTSPVETLPVEEK